MCAGGGVCVGVRDRAGSVIDNHTGFESPDLETRTLAEGERETARGSGWGIVHAPVCRRVC